MAYPEAAWERAMKVQEVLLKALSGEIHCYRGFNVRHFHQIARREHGVTVSYSFLKQTLQAAGLVKKHRVRGRHRRRREPRACFGELLHIDGSPHAWLALRPTERAVLIAVLDDAIMTALHDVITTHGLPMAVARKRRFGGNPGFPSSAASS